MKRSVKITLIIAAALVCLGACLAAVVFGMGGRLSQLRGLQLDPATGTWRQTETDLAIEDGYTGGELKLLEMVQYTASDAGGEVWYYSDTSDDFFLEQPDGTYKRNPAFREISEREANRINGKYTYEILPFTLFEA